MNIDEKFESAVGHYEGGDLPRAAGILKEVLSLRPADTDALYLLAEISYRLGNLDDALDNLQKALHYGPRSAEAYSNIGFILQEKNQFDEAIEFYEKALQLNSDLFETHINLACIFEGKGQFDEAIKNYQKALRLNPESPVVYSGLGTALLKAQRYDEAAVYYRRALELSPHDPTMQYNFGIALQEKGFLDEAITCYQKALEFDPQDPEAYNNLAFALQENRRPYEALGFYEKALQLAPQYATAHWNFSLALLLTGNFREGWKEYEWRWETKYLASSKRNFGQPLWSGFDIDGLTILLHAEQGLGDTFQFIRYAPLVAARGARVIVECPGETAALMQRVEGIERVILRGEELPQFDVQCPLLSLPLAFDTTIETIPAAVPYISADSSLTGVWKDRLRDDASKLKVGITWAGNPGFKQNRYRNIPLHFLASLSELPGISLYSLQKGEEAAEAKNPPGVMRLIDYTDGIRDFSDTAALIENLDLVISVDTSVAHLAGAMGREVWTLLPFSPEWRWLMDREDSPWYPTMRLFRQTSHNDWKSVIDRVKDELRQRD